MTFRREQGRYLSPTNVLPRFLVASLKRYRERQEVQREKPGDAWQALDLVFCGPTGGYRHQTKTRESFNRLLKKIGLPHMRVHDLRHNASSFLQIVLRMPAKMVQDILGHDDLEMTFDYTHSDLDIQRGMMDDLDKFFDDLSGEE